MFGVISVDPDPDDTARLVMTTRCPDCKELVQIRVFRAEARAYDRGAFIQDAFKNYHASVREMMQTGYDPQCWAKMMEPMT